MYPLLDNTVTPKAEQASETDLYNNPSSLTCQAHYKDFKYLTPPIKDFPWIVASKDIFFGIYNIERLTKLKTWLKNYEQ